jgi:hypothetical protein
MHRPFIITLIVIAGVAAVPSLACAENPPAAMDSCVAAFMTSVLKQTSAIKLRESDYLNSTVLITLTPEHVLSAAGTLW